MGVERAFSQRSDQDNCGGLDYTDRQGKVWSRDRFYRGGFAESRDGQEIKETEEDALYLRERFFFLDDSPRGGYQVPLPPGRYRVCLHFCETHLRSPGRRSFTVHLEKQRVLEDFEPKAAGPVTAQEKVFEVDLADGFLDIDIAGDAGEPAQISALEIQPVAPASQDGTK